MKWSNLKQNKCPKCNKAFGFQAFTAMNIVVCPAKDCGFKISHKRYSNIVSSQINSDLDRKYDQELEEGEVNL